MDKRKINGIGAAEVLAKFLFTRKKNLKIQLESDNKIVIPQTSQLELLMYFQKWQLENIDIKFIATRFAHECRLNGCVTNDDTLRCWDEFIKVRE